MSDDEELRRAFAKEMGEDADDESSNDEGAMRTRLSCNFMISPVQLQYI